jgi:hypothetical protein
MTVIALAPVLRSLRGHVSVIYRIDFWELMEAGEKRINDSGKSHLFLSLQDKRNQLLRSARLAHCQ